MTNTASQITGSAAIFEAFKETGLSKKHLDRHSRKTIKKFGSLIDKINHLPKTATVKDVAGIIGNEVPTEIAENLHDDNGSPLEGFSSKQGIKLDASLTGNKAKSTGIEEVIDSLRQKITGNVGRGDAGAIGAAILDGSFGGLSKKDKKHLRTENDVVTVDGKIGEASEREVSGSNKTDVLQNIWDDSIGSRTADNAKQKPAKIRLVTNKELKIVKGIIKDAFSLKDKDVDKIDDFNLWIASVTNISGGDAVTAPYVYKTTDGKIGNNKKNTASFFKDFLYDSDYSDTNYEPASSNILNATTFHIDLPIIDFLHELVHQFQNTGIIKYADSYENSDFKDDYDYADELASGLKVEQLTREDQAQYIAKTYANRFPGYV